MSACNRLRVGRQWASSAHEFNASSASKQVLRAEVRVVILLGISVFINYIDRGNLSIAAPLLKDELGLSASRLGILLSSFFWTYACFQIVSGWLVDRFNVNRVMAAGFLLWSLATAVTAGVHGFAALLAVRLILGMGESVAYPSYSKILARYLSEEQRGVANSVIVAGAACGPAFGMFMGGMLMAKFGWRPFFLAVGLASLLWLLPWIRWKPTWKPRRMPSLAVPLTRTPGIEEILRQRSAWGTCGGLFSLNYLSYFLITWMPFYLVRTRHFSMAAMAEIAGGSYLSAAVAAMICGWIGDRWIEFGGTTTLVRKTFTGGGMILGAISLVGCVAPGTRLPIVMLMVATASYGICSSNMWAITQTLAGPQTAGRWTGVQNFMGNLSGWVAPALTGFVIDRTGAFFWPFLIAAAVALLGSISWIFVVGKVEEVNWERKPVAGLASVSADVV